MSDLDAESGMAADTEQYLTFLLGEEEYGIDIRRVQEVRGWEAVTPMPNAPAYIKGVINLRGDIVPVIDLRERFAQQAVAYTSKTVVVVIKVAGGCNTSTVGIVVDAVSDVYNLQPGQFRPPPDFCATVHTEYVRGLADVGGKMIILLDSEGLLQTSELLAVRSLPGQSASQVGAAA